MASKTEHKFRCGDCGMFLSRKDALKRHQENYCKGKSETMIYEDLLEQFSQFKIDIQKELQKKDKHIEKLKDEISDLKVNLDSLAANIELSENKISDKRYEKLEQRIEKIDQKLETDVVWITDELRNLEDKIPNKKTVKNASKKICVTINIPSSDQDE